MTDPESISRAEKVAAKAEELALTLERMKMQHYIVLLQNARRWILLNFVSGVARGLGIAVGFAILGALVIYLLQRTVMLNLPVIGTFIAELVTIIQNQLGP